MLAREYTDALKQRLPGEMFRPAPERVLWIGVHAIIVAVCTAAIVNAHLGVLIRLALALLIGVSFCCIGIVGHEIVHGSVVQRLWLRRILGALCLAPIGIGPTFFAIWHNTHHANTQNPSRDPDNWGTLDGSPLDPGLKLLRRVIRPRTLLFPVMLATGVTAHAAMLLFCTQRQMTTRQRLETLAEFVALWCFWLGLGFWLGWVNFLFFFLIPLLVANFISNLFVVTNHFLNPLDEDGGDPLAGSLTVTTYRWAERLLLNFNYHAEHHLFPRMSPKYAPQIARLLKETWPDHYHQLQLGQALLRVWGTPRIYYDSTRLIDARDGTLYPTLEHGLDMDMRKPKARQAS